MAVASLAACGAAWLLRRGPLFDGLILGANLLTAVSPFLSPRSNRATADDEALLEDLGDRPLFLVQVHIVQNGWETGGDRGVVFFEEGAVCFVGHATSFRIGRQDAVRPRDFDEYVLRRGEHRWRRIPLKDSNRRIWLGFECLKRRNAPPGTTEQEFADALDAFFAGSPAEGPRQYPPLEPPPKARALARSRKR